MKLARWTQNYLLVAFLPMVMLMFWNETPKASPFLEILWNVLSWNLMLWFAVFIFFLIQLIFVPSTRTQVLQRLANIKDRDERESYITGRASKTAFLSTLSILIFLFFISIFQVNVERRSAEEAINGKRGSISLAINFKFFDAPKVENNHVNKVKTLFSMNDLPMSKSAILIMLICLQILIYNFSAKKLTRS